MIEPVGQERCERVLAGVPTRSVTAVVTHRDRLGQRDVQTQCPGDGGRNLRDLERVREPCALVIVREDEHLRLARQAPERRRVEDPITVPLEARPQRVGSLLADPATGTHRTGRSRGERIRLGAFPRLTVEHAYASTEHRGGVGMSHDQAGRR